MFDMKAQHKIITQKKTYLMCRIKEKPPDCTTYYFVIMYVKPVLLAACTTVAFRLALDSDKSYNIFANAAKYYCASEDTF